jgi:hypothetical protein
LMKWLFQNGWTRFLKTSFLNKFRTRNLRDAGRSACSETSEHRTRLYSLKRKQFILMSQTWYVCVGRTRCRSGLTQLLHQLVIAATRIVKPSRPGVLFVGWWLSVKSWHRWLKKYSTCVSIYFAFLVPSLFSFRDCIKSPKVFVWKRLQLTQNLGALK